MEKTKLSAVIRKDREDEKRMLPCRFYLAGVCLKASRCRFYHPAFINAYGNSPPLPTAWLQDNNKNVFQNQGQTMNGDYSNNRQLRNGNRGYRGRTRRSSEAEDRGAVHPDLPPPIFSEPKYDHTRACRSFYTGFRFEMEEDDPIREEHEDPLSSQNTLFNHINWKQFLSPGNVPPAPTDVNQLLTKMMSSPAVKLRNALLLAASNRTIGDTPPEGSSHRAHTAAVAARLAEQEIMEAMGNGRMGTMSAKHELLLKINKSVSECDTTEGSREDYNKVLENFCRKVNETSYRDDYDFEMEDTSGNSSEEQ